MKKILLLLLLATFSIQAQTLQNPTYGNVKLKNNTTDNSATKVNVQSTDGTINTISKSDLVNVVEVNDVPTLPLVGEVGKIYVVKNVNKIYRWNGTFYQELAGSDISGLQAQIDLKANDSDVVKLTGNQTISGQKSFSLTGKIDMQTNDTFPAIMATAIGINGRSAAEFINRSSFPNSNALRLQTSPSGGVGNRALDVSNQSSIGTGIFSIASSGGVSISSQSGNGDSYISNITYGGTGRNYVGRNDGIETYSVDKTGNVIGNSYIKRSTPANNILLAGGGDLAQGTAFNKNFGTTAGTVVEGGTLGSNAYNSTAYLPLSGGTVNGLVSFNATTGGVVSFQTNSLPSALMTNSQNIIGAGSATDFNTYVYGNNPYNIWTNGVKRVTVDGSGNVDFTGIVTAPTAPAGTNTTQIATTAFVQSTTNTNALLLTGNQSFTGYKTSTSSDASPSGFNLTNSNTTTGAPVANFNNSALASNNSSTAVRISNSNAGDATSAIQVINENAGFGSFQKNISSGIGSFQENWSTGLLVQLDSRTGSTGDLIRFTKHGLLTGKVNQNGEITAPKLTMTGTIKMMEYTVATLPTPTGTAYATVTDALAPTYMATVVGGGAVVTPVFYNGTNWVAH